MDSKYYRINQKRKFSSFKKIQIFRKENGGCSVANCNSGYVYLRGFSRYFESSSCHRLSKIMEQKTVSPQIFWNSLISDKIELDVIDKINDGEILQVLKSDLFKQLFAVLGEEENVINGWKSKIIEHAGACESVEKQLEFLAVGAASLLLFIQQNWTGPNVDIKHLCLLNYGNEVLLMKEKSSILEELVMVGENVFSSVQCPELLLLSKLVLKQCHYKFSSKISCFWYLRSLFIHQQVLEEHSIKLFDEIQDLMSEVKNFMVECKDLDLTEEYLEFARIHIYYNYVQKSKFEIEKALEYSGIKTSLTGALGKRTKFQTEDLAQLTLKIDIPDSNVKAIDDINIEAKLPPDLKLNDEVRLNKIKFKHDEDGEHPNLSGLQQANILGLFCQTQKFQPKDKLTDEELQPLISCILDRPKVWSIKFSTLLFRSKLESNNKRSVERAMMQVETLTDSVNNDKPPLADRLRYFFISYQPPRWEVESCLAKIMVSVGAYKSALDIYLKLEDWENVIHCYNMLEMRHKAQEIIEQELKKNPTPKLWCYLGDATEDVSHYETAWKLSKERSARAQRHWAMHYYNRREYDKSIRHFEISLEKNSLQNQLWYRLGYAALHEEKWEISANAYRRYCVLDPECFEAWNNLARCYCELNQIRRAWKALQEALKVDYSNWRVWDNYMLVSSDLKEFDEVVRSYHQILNLKDKHVDIPILKAVVQGFKEAEDELRMKPDSEEKEASLKDLKKFREKLLTLFGRLTSQVVGESKIWYLYSKIVPSEENADYFKRYNLLLKSYNAIVNKKNWLKTMESCKEVVDLASELIDCCILVGQKSVLMSCQLSVKGCLTIIKKEYPQDEVCYELEKKLSLLTEKIDS